jgi:hypothetical protein
MDTSRQVPAVIADKSETLGTAPAAGVQYRGEAADRKKTLVEGASVGVALTWRVLRPKTRRSDFQSAGCALPILEPRR